MSEGPLFAYRARVAEGALVGDPAQELAAEKLQSLFHALKGYRPRQAETWKERFGLGRRADEPPALLLELLDLLTKRGLGDAETFGVAPEVQLLGDRDDIPEMA